MRQITGQITEEIQAFIGDEPLDKADAYPVTTYRRLVFQVAKLAYLNKDYLLFFRGQGVDYRNRAGASTLYPTIYRGDYLFQEEITHRFKILENASEMLRKIFEEEEIQGYTELMWKKHIQWSILQHYGVYETPLFDLTHSIRVACSFAQYKAQEGKGYVYVFGMPYVMNRISHNSEHDLVNIRLLSICPPEALRPYFQEGYLAGTEDITDFYDSKDKLDFRNRLIAKFEIPSQARFWGEGFDRIPDTVLYPRGDRIEKLCREIKKEVCSHFRTGMDGQFLCAWKGLGDFILSESREREGKVFSIGEAINVLAETGVVDQGLVYRLQELRKFRNVLAYKTEEFTQEEIEERMVDLQEIRRALDIS